MNPAVWVASHIVVSDGRYRQLDYRHHGFSWDYPKTVGTWSWSWRKVDGRNQVRSYERLAK